MLLIIIICSTLSQRTVLSYDHDQISFPDDDEYNSKNNYHHHNQHHHHPRPSDTNFQHNPDFHRHHPELPFPHNADFHHHHEEDLSRNGPNKDYDTSSNLSSIPLDLIMKYNNFEEVNDVLLNLVEGSTEEKTEPVLLASRFGEERSAAITPKSAGCMPELQTVRIATTDDPSVLYIPSCTRIERCGGCCSHNLLSCQPVDTETVSFQVVKTQFQGGSKLKFMGKEVVLIEKHTKCKCSCKVQAKDCNGFQQYREGECRCVCTNTDEEKKCHKDGSLKLWNPEVCSCQCRNISQCSTGYTFDMLRCKCVPVLVRRRYAELVVEKKLVPPKNDALPVLPLRDVSD